MKLPKWMKNITKKMAIIWAVSFAAFLIVAFGTTCIVLVAIPAKYGAAINYNNVFYIEYMNETHRKALFDKSNALHSKPMQDILNRLSDGSKTNKLTNLFRGNPEQEVEAHTVLTISSLQNTYANNAIIIWFTDPQYSVESTSSSTKYRLSHAAANTSSQVHAILIPLDKTGNRFQQQTWYLLTNNPNEFKSESYMTIATKINAWGNYNKLGQYVDDLYVRL